MHGVTRLDDQENPVRILDIVQGREIGKYVYNIKADHEAYFRERFPAILDHFLGACEAIGTLHAQGEKHGDIRRDHLFIEYGTGQYRWIDFDYTFDFHENPYGLVIGRRGVSKAEEFLFGSVSNKLIHHAKDRTVWVVS